MRTSTILKRSYVSKPLNKKLTMTNNTKIGQLRTLNAKAVSRGTKLETDPAELVADRNTKPVPRTPQRATRNTQPAWWWIDLGTVDYRKAWKLQTEIVAARNNKIIDTDLILMLEHPPVFTLGRRGGTENLLVSEAFLEQSGIAVTQVERGGNITYHGPGQLVVYPIVDLEAAGISVVEFVEALEQVMIRTAEVWGIKAERNSANRGIWVGDKKMGSIGIALRKGISFHGLALNVNLDLTPFSWIQPCGLQGVRMTSMEQELSEKVSMGEVRKVIKEQMQVVFGAVLVSKSEISLFNILKTQTSEQSTINV
jgi:lipoate-protein ligase B